MRTWSTVVVALVLAAPLAGRGAGPQASRPIPAVPVLVMTTAKGTIEIELFKADAPKSVEHVVTLVRRNFYTGLRFHRVTDSLIQVGDPQSRKMTLEAYWGTQNSGSPINVVEVPKNRKHVRGAVGLAYSGGPQYADSQFYIMKVAHPELDGKYAVIGQVTSGMAVVDKIVKTDLVRTIVVKGDQK